MNLKEIVDKIYDAAELLDAEALISESNSLQNVADQLTPRSMDQKPKHEQWCLVLKKDMICFIAQYNMYLDAFVDELSFYKSESFKWLPAPQWKEGE